MTHAEEYPATADDALPGRAGRIVWSALLGGLVCAGLILADRLDYLLFHSLVEIFSVVVAAGIFVIAWNARGLLVDNYLLFLGVAYLFVGGLDLVHVLAYQGMGVFPGHGANLPTQIWIGARYLESLSLLVAPLFLRRRLKLERVVVGYAAVTAALLASIFFWLVFPRCWVEGTGLTTFKKLSEYVICLILVGAAAYLYLRRQQLDRAVFRYLFASIIATIGSELAFTRYQDPYGGLNQLGHGLKLVSYYLVYKAIIETGLRKPLALLFRDLKQSEETLQRTNLELQGYAHTVSHDLKNPLTAILVAAQGMEEMLDQPLDRQAAAGLKSMAEVVVRSSRKATSLVDDLLRLAEAGQQPPSVEPVDVNEVVARVLEERAAVIAERGIEVKVDGDLGRVTAAPAHVYQVFSNLIGNAIAHGHADPLRIEVGRESGPAEDGAHRYLVRDNGRGIPPEHLAQIFAPFFKGERGGNGIGLSTVERIVKLYGGAIRAYNDRGACFELSLRDYAGK